MQMTEKLSRLLEEGCKAYGLKNYELAAESYGMASKIAAEERGDADSSNAEILFYYGRAVYQCAVKKSEVLGGEIVGNGLLDPTKEAISNVVLQKSPKKPGAVFQFDGDESDSENDGKAPSNLVQEQSTGPVANGNHDDSTNRQEYLQPDTQSQPRDNDDPDKTVESKDDHGGSEEEEDDDDVGNDEEEEEEEEEDDFAIAWQVLDLARVLYEKQSDPSSNDKQNLAEVLDLLGEVSLESENFPQAVSDLNASLKLKSTLYPMESTIMSEAHFKLALALEFADLPDGRQKAAEHVKSAIDSCQMRIDKEISQQDSEFDSESSNVVEARDLITELKSRLQDLQRSTPAELSDPLEDALGESANQVKDRLALAMAKAKDVSSLVRKKQNQQLDNAEEPPNKRPKVESE